MVLEFDPKCGTVQPEDTLELFVPRYRKDEMGNNGNGGKSGANISVNEIADVSRVSLQDEKNEQAFWPVLHKMSNMYVFF